MTERRGPLPGIAKLREMEIRTKYETKRNQAQVSHHTVTPTNDNSIDPYQYFDDRRRKGEIKEIISNYIDSINTTQKSKNDMYAQWHRQDDGRLSKNITNRQKLIAKRFWEQTLK